MSKGYGRVQQAAGKKGAGAKGSVRTEPGGGRERNEQEGWSKGGPCAGMKKGLTEAGDGARACRACQGALPSASEHRTVLVVLGRVGSRPLWLPHGDVLGRACMAVVRRVSSLTRDAHEA